LDDRVLLALLDRVLGNPAALKPILGNCAVPEHRQSEYEGSAPGAFCHDLVYVVSTRSVDILGTKASPVFVDLLEEETRAVPTDWPRRMDCIRHVMTLDPARARALDDAVLAVPATLVPLNARLQALSDIGKTSRILGDYPRALAAYDRYLDLQRYRPAPIPEGLWKRLTALPELETGKRAEEDRLDALFLTFGLARKAEVLADMKDFAGARRGIESYLAMAFALGDGTSQSPRRLADLADVEGMDPSERAALQALLDEDAHRVALTARDEARHARRSLAYLAEALHKAGRTEEAKRVLSYLITQPGGEHLIPFDLYPLYYQAKERGEPLKPAESPWNQK
jgi:tetratricopeptide (TPR) repeat protein